MMCDRRVLLLGVVMLWGCGADGGEKSASDPIIVDTATDMASIASAYQGVMSWEERNSEGRVVYYEEDPEEWVIAFVSHDGKLSFDGFTDECAIRTKPGSHEIPWQVCGTTGTVESGSWRTDGELLAIEMLVTWTDPDTSESFAATVTFDGAPDKNAVFGRVDPAAVPEQPLQGELEGEPFAFVSGRAVEEFGDVSIDLFGHYVDSPCDYEPQDGLWVSVLYEGAARSVADLRSVDGHRPAVTVTRKSDSGHLGYHVHRGEVRIANNTNDTVEGGLWAISHEGDSFIAGEFVVPVCDP